MSGPTALIVDVGATTIKSARFDDRGEQIGNKNKRRTIFPCTPDVFMSIIGDLVSRHDTRALAVGFPGETVNGVVRDGANLTRLGGPGTAIDDQLVQQWRHFDLQRELASYCSLQVVVENDAAFAARGCATGEGTELVVTLGSGCGLALMKSGQLVQVRDVGSEILTQGRSYDEVLGEKGRRKSEGGWVIHVVSAVGALANEFGATSIHLCGGNARRLSRHSFGAMSHRVFIERNDCALLGGFRSLDLS